MVEEACWGILQIENRELRQQGQGQDTQNHVLQEVVPSAGPKSTTTGRWTCNYHDLSWEQLKFKPYINCFQNHLYRYTKNHGFGNFNLYFSQDYANILVLFLHFFCCCSWDFYHIYIFSQNSIYQKILVTLICLLSYPFVCCCCCSMYIYVQITGQLAGVVPLIPPCGFWGGTQCCQAWQVPLAQSSLDCFCWTIFHRLYVSYYKDKLKTECVCVKLGSVIYQLYTFGQLQITELYPGS